MFVCHCAVVTDRDVVASIASGARSVAAVCRDTAAGRSCGRCVPTLRALVCQHCPSASLASEEMSGATR